MAKRGILDITSPIESGIINNWDDMEKIWHHCYYNELKTCPDDHNVLLTEAPRIPKKQREIMISLFFENFNVPKFYLSKTGILALYASGRTTGCIVSSGFGITHVV